MIPLRLDPVSSNGSQCLFPPARSFEEFAPLLGRLGEIFPRKILALEKVQVCFCRFLRFLLRRSLQWPSEPIHITFAKRRKQRSPRPPCPSTVPKGEGQSCVTSPPQAGLGRETRLGQQGLCNRGGQSRP